MAESAAAAPEAPASTPTLAVPGLPVQNDAPKEEITPETAPDKKAESAAGETATPAGEEKPQAGKKMLTQDEVNAIVQREKAKAEARALRQANRMYQEHFERMGQQPQPQRGEVDDGRPRQENFQDVDQYVAAVVKYELDQTQRASQQQRMQAHQAAIAQKTEGIYQNASKVDPEFDRDAFDELPLTPAIAAALTESDVSAELMVFMTKNPEDVARIARMHPARQAAEMGKLEVKMARAAEEAAAALKAVQDSKLPAPPTPIAGVKGGSKNPADMTDAEYAQWRRKGRS